MHPDRAYEGLTRARQKLLDWIRPLSQEQYTQQLPIGLHTVRTTLLEIVGGEWIFTRRLQGESLPPREEWPITQAMAMLRLLGVEAQNLDYSLFMYTRREEPA